MAAPRETMDLPNIVIEPYTGDWHDGIDILRLGEPLGISKRQVPNGFMMCIPGNKSNRFDGGRFADVLRRFAGRALQLADHGVTALQLVGWNQGGQDRGNPSHDPDVDLGPGTISGRRSPRLRSSECASFCSINLFGRLSPVPTMPRLWIARPSIRTACHTIIRDTSIKLGPVDGINNRRFMVACLHDPAWISLCEQEFEKSLSLGASGIFYDEAFHHYAATHCFSEAHGHRNPATMASGDLGPGRDLPGTAAATPSMDFLLSAEAPFDLQHQHYALSYFPDLPGAYSRRALREPYYPIMIAVTGFDDQGDGESGTPLSFCSYEPFNFKGDPDDFPLTIASNRGTMHFGPVVVQKFCIFGKEGSFETRSAPK